jgi:hypothetical protein
MRTGLKRIDCIVINASMSEFYGDDCTIESANIHKKYIQKCIESLERDLKSLADLQNCRGFQQMERQFEHLKEFREFEILFETFANMAADNIRLQIERLHNELDP